MAVQAVLLDNPGRMAPKECCSDRGGPIYIIDGQFTPSGPGRLRSTAGMGHAGSTVQITAGLLQQHVVMLPEKPLGLRHQVPDGRSFFLLLDQDR